MIYKWFTVEKTAAMCISMSSLLPLWSCRQNRRFLTPLEPLLWLADCTLSGTLPGLSLVSFWRIHSGKHSWKLRRDTRFQSLTTGCFWTLSYTVLMLVQVIAGQSANVGVTSRVTVRSLSKDELLLLSLNSAWQMLHTTFVLRVFHHFASLIETFRPTIPQLSPSSTRSLLADWLQARGGFVSGENTGSKQSCVNCVKIFYRINRGHINLID